MMTWNHSISVDKETTLTASFIPILQKKKTQNEFITKFVKIFHVKLHLSKGHYKDT